MAHAQPARSVGTRLGRRAVRPGAGPGAGPGTARSTPAGRARPAAAGLGPGRPRPRRPPSPRPTVPAPWPPPPRPARRRRRRGARPAPPPRGSTISQAGGVGGAGRRSAPARAGPSRTSDHGPRRLGTSKAAVPPRSDAAPPHPAPRPHRPERGDRQRGRRPAPRPGHRPRSPPGAALRRLRARRGRHPGAGHAPGAADPDGGGGGLPGAALHLRRRRPVPARAPPHRGLPRPHPPGGAGARPAATGWGPTTCCPGRTTARARPPAWRASSPGAPVGRPRRRPPRAGQHGLRAGGHTLGPGPGAGALRAALRGGRGRWRRRPGLARAVPPGRALHGDDRRIVATALGRLRGKLTWRPVVFELLPETFSLSALQACVEALAGRHLHTPNFRAWWSRAAWWRARARTTTGAGRPAELHRFRREVLRERPAPGVGLRSGAAAPGERRVEPSVRNFFSSDEHHSARSEYGAPMSIRGRAALPDVESRRGRPTGAWPVIEALKRPAATPWCWRTTTCRPTSSTRWPTPPATRWPWPAPRPTTDADVGGHGRGALHGRDREAALPDKVRAAARPARRLLPGRLHHRRGRAACGPATPASPWWPTSTPPLR